MGVTKVELEYNPDCFKAVREVSTGAFSRGTLRDPWAKTNFDVLKVRHLHSCWGLRAHLLLAALDLRMHWLYLHLTTFQPLSYPCTYSQFTELDVANGEDVEICFSVDTKVCTLTQLFQGSFKYSIWDTDHDGKVKQRACWVQPACEECMHSMTRACTQIMA